VEKNRARRRDRRAHSPAVPLMMMTTAMVIMLM